jgi:hypothetical protein
MELNVEIQKSPDFEKNSKLIRNPNFPSELSELLVMFCYHKLFNVQMEWKIGADLWKEQTKHEVKAFVSGPTSFSPVLKFKTIFFLDASDVMNGSFVLYHVRCDSEKFKNLKVNLTSSFKDFEKTKNRPRCLFNDLLKQWRENKIPVDFYMVDINVEVKDIVINRLFFPI